MTNNKPFWDQVEKQQAELEIFRERAQKRRFRDDPVRCDKCGTGVQIGDNCPSCGLKND